MSTPHLAYIPRLLQLAELLSKKSHFLLGPRQTGKTSLIRHELPNAKVFNLLDSSVYLALSQNPKLLEEEERTREKTIVIDEIQRLPELLNEVQRLIEERGWRFLLTGSSARKLRRAGTNLLGGRARIKYLHPLTSQELGPQFDLNRAIHHGLIPSIYRSDDPDADLEAYAGTYLQQEIVAEAATRNIAAFSRFLKVAALSNGTIINFTNVASDAQVPRTTVYEYFEILRDTLILHELPAWGEAPNRKPIVSSKYFFFDIGVVRWLQGRKYTRGTKEFGDALETLIMQELIAYRDYKGGAPLRYWRSTSGFEVDFLIGEHVAVEVKGKPSISPHDLRSLHAIADEKKFKRRICVSLEQRARTVDGIEILPLASFLKALWDGDFSYR